MNEPIDVIKNRLLCLQESLKEKWYKNSEIKIGKFCPFCWVWFESCDADGECLCPSTICKRRASGGYIAELIEQYGSFTKIKKLNPKDLNKMRKLFIRAIRKCECQLMVNDFEQFMFRKKKLMRLKNENHSKS